MIVDYLKLADRYSSVQSRMAAGFAFLRRAGVFELPDGRISIDGDQVFAIIQRIDGRGRDQSLLEAHRKYLDIQYVVKGEDCIGWLPLSDCHRVSTPYDPEKDIEFFYDRPATWVTIPAGAFAVFFPDDAHAPLATEGRIHKIVIKIALDQAARVELAK